jgi:hypothetical protein
MKKTLFFSLLFYFSYFRIIPLEARRLTMPACSVTLTKTDVSCNGGSDGTATATPVSAPGPYNYLWLPGNQTTQTATGLSAGTYTVTMTANNGCTATASITINQPSAIALNVISSPETCTNASGNNGNGSATVNASGGTPGYIYSWAPSGGNAAVASNLSTGTYTVTVTDAANCMQTASVTIGLTNTVSAAFSPVVNQCFTGNSYNFTNTGTSGVGATYFWYFGGSSNPLNSTTNNPSGVSFTAPGTYTVSHTVTMGSCSSTSSQQVTVYVNPSVSISQTNVSCFGGNNGSAIATINPAGTYTYNWLPSGGTGATASGLSAGTYTVTATSSNGCSNSATVTITQPPAFVATISKTNVSCSGGSNGTATVNLAGAPGPYTYFWSPTGGTGATISNLTARSYTVTVVSSGGCIATASTTLTEPLPLTFDLKKISPSKCGGCNGDLHVDLLNGNSPFTYTVFPNTGHFVFNGAGTKDFKGNQLCGGNYVVNFTDASGCITAYQWTIDYTNYGPATISAQTNVSCNGGSNGAATVAITGGTAPFTYVWSPGGQATKTATGLSAGTYTVSVTDTDTCSVSTTVTITQPAALTAVTSQTNVSCFGGNTGSASVIIAGGTPGYTYSWSPSGGTAATASNLVAGIYTVTITDSKGCQLTKTFTISQPAAYSIVTTQTNVLCNGANSGSAAAAVSGGTTPYTYFWSPAGGAASTATGLTSGGYTVTITDSKGCVTTKPYTITQPVVLSLTPSQTTISCGSGNNGTATITPAGGTAPYTYSWSTAPVQTTATASGLTAGTYTATVSDLNGCTATQSITITQPTTIIATVTKTDVSCNNGTNGSATVAVSGGTAPYTYNWAPSGGTSATASGLAAGTYTVTVTDFKGCTAATAVTITQPALLTAATVTTTIACNGGSTASATVTASGGTPGYTYLWSPSGGTSSIANGLSAGTYTVTVTDNKNCIATKSVTISEPLGMILTTNSVSTTCGSSNGQVSVSVSGGNPGYTYSWSPGGSTAATMTSLPAGSYTVTVTDASSCVKTATVTVNNIAAATATITVTNEDCKGGNTGSAAVALTGGTSPFTYIWSPSGGTSSNATALAAGNYTVTVTDANTCITTASATITEPAALTISSTQTNVSCNGGTNGSATVTVGGGTPGYTYNWSPSGGNSSTATNLVAGSYTLTATDAKGCTISATVVITAPTVLSSFIATSSTVTCNGGSNGTATIIASGGSPGYTYNWLPSGGTSSTAIGLSAGTYTVTSMDSKGCTTTSIATINQLPAIAATVSQTDVSCNGDNSGSATVIPSGGTGSYNYFWSPNGGTAASATGLSAGSFSVTITDANACQLTKTVTITQPAALTATVSSSVNVFCNGSNTGAATATGAGGTAPYTYLWNSIPSQTTATASNLVAGAYNVMITDFKGCTAAATITINQSPSLGFSVTQTDVSCKSGSDGAATVSVTGGNAPYAYNWVPSGGAAATAGGLSAGSYTSVITDSKGCTVSAPVVIAEPSLLTSGIITSTNILCNGSAAGSATVSVTGGVPGYTYLWSSGAGTNATASGLSAGTYTITTADTKGCITSSSVTITEPFILSASIIQTNVSCNGGADGTASVTASGGTSPYTYSWSSSGGTAATATGLIAGTYSVTVTDANGCNIVKTVTITEPAALAFTNSQINVSCNGGSNGSATIAVVGGTPGYTYSWTPGGGSTATVAGLSAGTYTVLVTDTKGCTASTIYIITQPTALTATINQTNVSCNAGTNGSATVTINGGIPAYTYSWAPSGGTSNTATGLATGQYTLTTTDGKGCQLNTMVSITQPSGITITTSQINVSCNGGSNGSATASATGGVGPYTYFWKPYGGTTATASGLINGTYTVTVTDNNACQNTMTVSITQPPVLVSAITLQTNVSCAGEKNGAATVVASGGIMPYNYTWSTAPVQTAATATGLSAGTYTVNITDGNGCTSVSTVNITQPFQLTLSNTSINVSCNGGNNGSATVSASGGTAGYTYNWLPSGGNAASATNLQATTYTVIVTDTKGCTARDSMIITQPTALNANITAQTDASCNGSANGAATVVASGGTPGYSYAWSPTGGTNATANALAAGTYTVSVTDNNSCVRSATVIISQPASMVLTTSSVNSNCGGTNGSATVSVSGGTAGYSYTWNSSPVQTTATATGLPAGFYTVTVTDAGGCVKVADVIVNTNSSQTIAIMVTNTISCNGDNLGSAAITVTGGSAPFTYNWAPSGGTGSTATGLSAGTYTVTVTDVNGCIAAGAVTLTQPPTLSISTAHTNVSCNGGADGSASVSALGGTPGYIYNWAPSGGTGTIANGLIAGTYTVIATDSKGCTASSTVVINAPSLLTSAVTSNNITCNGTTNGSATVIAAGGTPGYSYLWTPSGGTAATATNLGSGMYTVTVTDFMGCQNINSVNIIQPSVISVTTSQINVSYSGGSNGSATVSATGGVAPYTYFWAPYGGTAATATGFIAGTYTVTVTDNNGCQKTATLVITQPPLLVSSISSQTNVSCAGGNNGTVTIVTSGGTLPYTYSWSTVPVQTGATASGLTSGTYTVITTDGNGNTAALTITVTQPPALLVNSTSINVSCNGGNNGSATVTVSGGTAGYTYNWLPNGGNAATAINLQANTYTVVVTDVKGCVAQASAIITQPTGLNVNLVSSTNASCNGSTNGSATVVASGGTPGYSYVWSPSGGTDATASMLTSGTYTVSVTDNNGCMQPTTVTISQPASLVLTTSHTNVLCYGGNTGSAIVSGTGGTGAYSYLWTPSGGTAATASNLAAGNYTVNVSDANSCSAAAVVTITQPSSLVAVMSSNNIVCNGSCTGTAEVAVSVGTAPYSYSWSPGGQNSAAINNLCAGTYSVAITDAAGCVLNQSVLISQPAAINTIVTKSDVNCFGYCNGTATAVTTGGSGPYTFLWNPGFQTTPSVTGLCAGTYSLTVTDANNCSIIKTITINQPTISSLTTTATAADCGKPTGSTCAVMTGGAPPYTYQWNDPALQTTVCATNISANSYTVTVIDANGCVSTATASVNSISGPVVTIVSSTNVTCAGASNGTATATITGGAAPYSIRWTGSSQTTNFVSGLSGGFHTITVTDASGCVATATVTILEPSSLGTAITSFTNPTCNLSCNGQATITAGGGTAPYTYLWNNSSQQTTPKATGLCAGTYTVTVTDKNGCTTTNAAIISQPAPLTVSTVNISNVSCNGGDNGTIFIDVSGGTPGYTYSWNPSVGSGAVVTNLTAGIYTVTITDVNGCTKNATYTILQPSAVALTITSTPVSCFGGNNGSVTVLSTGGVAGYNYKWLPTGGTASIANALSAGTYTVEVTDSHSCVSVASIAVSQPTQLSTLVSSTNASCNGVNNGSATVTVSNGTPGYIYSWSPGGGSASTASGLSPGSYTVTIYDQNVCSVTASATVGMDAGVVATISSTINSDCYGSCTGAAQVVASGGTLPYTYSWSPGSQNSSSINNLCAGSYLATVTDKNGCTSSAIANSGQPAVLNITSSITQVTCNGMCNGSVSIVASGGSGAYTYLWSPGMQTTSSLNSLCAGVYTVTVKDNKGCSKIFSIVISEPPPLLLTTSTISATCGKDNGSACVQVIGGMAPINYLWNDAASQVTTCATNLGPNSYVITVTDKNGCIQQSTIKINDIAGPALSITSSTNVTCAGASNGTATANIIGGTAPFTITWSGSTQSNAYATGLSAGSHTITVTDASGCIATATVNITEPGVLKSAISSSSNSTCHLSCDGTATETVGGGTPPYTYLWNTPSLATTPKVSGLCAGNYTVTVTDNNGCSNANTVLIQAPSAVAITITNVKNVSCFQGSDGSIQVAASGGTPGYVYSWQPVVGSGPFVTGLKIGTVTVTVIDLKGCTQTQAITITEPTAITATTAITPTTCNFANGSATVNPLGGTMPYKYVWNDPKGQVTQTATNLPSGNYTVIITDANLCTYTVSLVVPAVNAPVIDSIYSSPPSCFGTPTGTATVKVSKGTAPYLYQWSDPFNQTSSTASGLNAGKYYVTVTDAKGCIISDSVTLTQPQAMKVILSASDTSLCQGQPVQLFCAAFGGSPSYEYHWSTGDIGPGPITQTPTQTTIYSVYAIDASGCISPASFLTVTLTAPITVTAANVEACDGQPVTIHALASGGTGGPYTYTWSNGFIGPSQSVTILLNGSPETFTVTVSDGCSSLTAATVVVTAHPLASGSIILSDTVGCQPLTVHFTGNSDIGTTYTWNFGDGTPLIKDSVVNHTYPFVGTDTITLTITTIYGCQTVLPNRPVITVYPSPVADFSVSPSVDPIQNATTVYFTNLSKGATRYIWNFDDGNSSNEINPTHYYALSGDYAMTLIALNALGCADTFSIKTVSENYIHFANAFTPNPLGGNGGTYNYTDLNNDVFFPTSLGVVEYHLLIFNKWGEIIFESYDIKKGWDGYYKGSLCEQDVYVWKAFATFKDGSKFAQTGDVTLLR